MEGAVDDSDSGYSSPTGGQNALASRIVAALPQLSKKHKAIARFILGNADIVAFASAAEVGIRTQTSAATVVRFCQALGYEGYLEFQAAIRERMSSQRTAVERLKERLTGPIPNGDLLARVFATDIHNIERTALLTVYERLQAAAAELRRARQILVVGSGLAAGLVEFFAYSLQMMDLPARSVTGGEEPLALALAFLQAEDLVVGISFRRNPRHVLKAIEEAQTAGAKSISIADSELSPVAQSADYPFVVVTEGVVPIASPAAAMSLLNAFIADLSSDTSERTAHSLQQVDAAYKRSGLLEE
jgi:DNA-binding MurR/RpiR family transcriptional regulator